MNQDVPKDKAYTTKEAAEKLGIKERAVQTRCKRDNVRKKDNKYLITDSVINNWILKKEEELKQTQSQTQSATQNATQLDLEVESLKEQLGSLENINNFELERLEDFDFNFNNTPGNLVFVPKDKVYAEYTSEEYSIAEQKLNEWYTLQNDIENQQKVFDAEKRGSAEIIEHYKHQFEYQKEQSTRMLNIHEKLIEAIDKQNNIILQKQVIEAIDKKVIEKDTWKREN